MKQKKHPHKLFMKKNLINGGSEKLLILKDDVPVLILKLR